MAQLIFTTHARERMRERRLPEAVAIQAYEHPDESYSGKEYGTTEYRKYVNGRQVTLIIKQESGKRIVISAWCNPPFPGTFDEKKQRSWQSYQRAKGWKKFFLFLLRAIRGW